MAVDKRPQFTQPKSQGRQADPAKRNREPKTDFGMGRADPHDPYDRRKRPRAPMIDGFGHLDKEDD